MKKLILLIFLISTIIYSDETTDNKVKSAIKNDNLEEFLNLAVDSSDNKLKDSNYTFLAIKNNSYKILDYLYTHKIKGIDEPYSDYLSDTGMPLSYSVELENFKLASWLLKKGARYSFEYKNNDLIKAEIIDKINNIDSYDDLVNSIYPVMKNIHTPYHSDAMLFPVTTDLGIKAILEPIKTTQEIFSYYSVIKKIIPEKILLNTLNLYLEAVLRIDNPDRKVNNLKLNSFINNISYKFKNKAGEFYTNLFIYNSIYLLYREKENNRIAAKLYNKYSISLIKKYNNFASNWNNNSKPQVKLNQSKFSEIYFINNILLTSYYKTKYNKLSYIDLKPSNKIEKYNEYYLPLSREEKLIKRIAKINKNSSIDEVHKLAIDINNSFSEENFELATSLIKKCKKLNLSQKHIDSSTDSIEFYSTWYRGMRLGMYGAQVCNLDIFKQLIKQGLYKEVIKIMNNNNLGYNEKELSEKFLEDSPYKKWIGYEEGNPNYYYLNKNEMNKEEHLILSNYNLAMKQYRKTKSSSEALKLMNNQTNIDFYYVFDPVYLSKKKFASILNDYAYFIQNTKPKDWTKTNRKFLERVIELSPNRAVAYYNLGDTYYFDNKEKYRKTIKKYYSKYKSLLKKDAKLPKRVIEILE